MTRRGVPLTKLWQAFDEARFGAERTLNLRLSLPTADEATRRTDAWLRQQQIAQTGDVLIITGRGKGSDDGVSVVREAVIRLLHALKRKGVVATHEEHTLDALQPQTRDLLRDLAARALDHLGVHDRDPFLEGEMLRQFGVLAAGIPEGVERERWLREAIRRAMEAYD